MPITLRDSLEPLVLRDSAQYAPGQAQGVTYLEAQDTNPLTRGWNATGEGLVASQLLAEANAAERNGDIGLSQALQRRAQDHMQQAQTWAPTTQNFDEINSLGSGAEWLAGSVGGGLRSMIAPVAGGALGSLAGGAVGMLTRNPGLGARAAQVLAPAGAFVPGYDMAYNETVGQAMMDPEVRARSTAQDIHNTGQVAGAVSGALDAIVPAGMAKIAVGGMGKRLAGRTIPKDMFEESVTEGAQNIVGQTAQNQLRGDDLTNYDYRSAFNDAMAGAVAGGAISAGGVGVGKLRDKIAAGGEAVADTARDPVGKVIEAMKARAEKQGREQAQQEIAAGNTPLEKMFQQSAEQAASDRFFDLAPRDATDEEVSASARASADQWADKILSSQPRTFGPREGKLREAAAQYKSDGDWLKFRAVLKENNLRTTQDEMAASFDTGEKASEMTPEGKELDALSKAWLANEGKRFGEYFDGSDEANGLGAKMFAWIKSDFGKKLTENGEIFIPRAFIEALGDRAPGVVESAVTAARKEGWDIRDAGDAVNAIRDYVDSSLGDTAYLKKAIRYSQQNNWTQKMLGQFAKELRQKKGQLNKDDYRWFKTQVSDIAGVLEHFQKPSKYYKADKNQLLRSGSPKTQAEMDVDGESLELSVDRDGEVVSESSTSSAGITDNDGDWGSSVSEFDGDSKPEFIGSTIDGYPFDTADDRQVAKKNAKLGEYANDHSAFAKEIGVWQQAKRAAKGNKALLAEYEDSLIREHGNSLSDADFQGELNPVDLTDAERRAILGQINKRFRVIEVERTKSANDMAFDKKDVHLEKANPRDQELGPSQGILRFQRYNKDGSPIARPFVTSTQMLISKMFKSQGSLTGSTKYYEGTAQQLLQYLSDGVASLLQDPSFGGEGRPAKIAFTVKADGTPRWVDAKDIKSWPKNIALFRDKEDRQYTLGEALAQIDEQAKKSPKELRSELRTINWMPLQLLYKNDYDEDVAKAKVKQERDRVYDAIYGDNDNLVRKLYEHYAAMGLIPKIPSFTLDFDQDTLNPHNKLTVKEKKPWEKAEDLKKLLDLSTDKELRGRIIRARKLAWKRDFADSNALWEELVDSGKLQAAGIVTDVEVGRGNQVEEGQVGPDDLSAYDPDYIKRTEEGRMRSKSIEHEAQSVIGTSKAVSSSGSTVDVRGKSVNTSSGVKSISNDEGVLGEKRKYIKRDADGNIVPIYPVNISAEKLQSAKDWIVDVMRDGVKPMLTAISKMDLGQIRILEAALFGRDGRTEREHRVNETRIDEKGAHHRIYDKDLGGARTKGTGETYLSGVVQIGLLDTSNAVVANQYFGRNLRSAIAFLKLAKENSSSIKEAINDRKIQLSSDSPGVKASENPASDRAGQADSAGTEAGVVAQPGRGRATQDGELGADQQGRNAEDGVVKQDSWVMRIASLPRKDLKAFVNALPKEKLKRAIDVLESFFPVDNTNQFWQRNDLDNYTDAKSDTVFEAQELIRDRLSEDGDAKYSMMSTEIHNSLGKDGFAATHDSPIRHEGKFDWRAHQGKGEGHAAFGAGTYLSTSDGVHESYKKQFTAKVSRLTDAQRTKYKAKLEALRDNPDAAELRAEYEAALAEDDQHRRTFNPGTAATYHVTVNIEPEELLDWDNLLGHQFDLPTAVHKAATKAFAKSAYTEALAQGEDTVRVGSYYVRVHAGKIVGIAHEYGDFIDNTDPDFSEVVRKAALYTMTGEGLYTWLVRELGSQAAASDYLQSLGILGHKYDAAGGSNDTHPNYVIYDDSRIETNYVHFNKQNTTPSDQPIDPKQALEDLARMLGKDYDAKVVKNLGGKAGTWTKSGIKLAASAPNGAQYHEALHEMFSQMRKHGADNVRELIERVASSPLIMRKLEQLLEGHPKAIKQLKTPEEAAAFLFQFWNMGLINVGPETKSLFQTIKDWITNVAKDLYAAVNAGAREKRAGEKAAKMDQAEVRRLFEGLAAGGVADPDTRAAVYDALRKNTEAHQKAIDELGQRAEKFWRGMGKYVVTSETMLNLYSKHPELKNLIADRFHQMAGKSMKNQARDASLTARGGYIEAVHGETQSRLTKFERFLMDNKFDQKDMELAAKHLEANTQSSDKKIQSLIDFVHTYYGEMYDYATQSDVRRLDPNHPDRWVPLQKRKNYFTQSWSIEELSKDHDGFVSTLLDKHRKELEGMAKQANAELAAWNKNPKVKVQSPTAKNEVERAIAEFEQSGQIVGKLGINPVTPEMIAETIYTRLLNSTGLVDIQESEWSLGITPAAAAVNRRELDWLDKEAFSKYKSKDLVQIVTSYTRTMVKRAEYQKRFGYSGEVIAEAMDTAFLREMGGDKLVDDARTLLPSAIDAWKKAYAEFKAENPDATFPEPYPTLRMVGADLHRSQVGEDKANADMVAAEKTLRPAINAVRAMEGTLGNEISQGMRSFNSWVNTYEGVRLLPFALFTNFSDVIGITVQGGTLGDAWDAFTAGIREVRNTWVNEKGEDKRTMRAEEWGVSDAGALLDTLGQNYSSVYMSEKARAVNNKFFRIIGMEGWNRGVRITASAVGERVIMNWVSNGVDVKKPGEQARFERLYGEGFDPKSIKLDKDGNLDTSDAANRAAIQRFVQDAVMSSNPAVRATWMSDPRMATFAHLKNFAYAFHSVMLKGILAQAAQGNLRPALVAGLGYASISIAAGAIKEMLIPGDEPFWMQGGLDGYLEYGYAQANLGGVPQLWFDGVSQLDPAKLAGPFWDQIQNTLSAPLPGLKLNLSPVDGETDIISDRKLAVELAKALPAGNLAGRAMDSLIGE